MPWKKDVELKKNPRNCNLLLHIIPLIKKLTINKKTEETATIKKGVDESVWCEKRQSVSGDCRQRIYGGGSNKNCNGASGRRRRWRRRRQCHHQVSKLLLPHKTPQLHIRNFHCQTKLLIIEWQLLYHFLNKSDEIEKYFLGPWLLLSRQPFFCT